MAIDEKDEKTENCGNCHFSETGRYDLECRYNPPKKFFIGTEAETVSLYPSIGAEGWCGKWELRTR